MESVLVAIHLLIITIIIFLTAVIHVVFDIFLLEMRMWIPLAVFVAWIVLRGWREKGKAALIALFVAISVYAYTTSGNKTHCTGYGYLTAADQVRLWRASVLQYLTLEPHKPWCSTAKCARKRSNRQEKAPDLQVQLVREAFRLVEQCAEERDSYFDCRKLLREDSKTACAAINCEPFRFGSKPWYFKKDGSPIRAVIFAHDPEGGDVRFTIYVDDTIKAPFLRNVAPGYARAFDATLKVFIDSLTSNLCPSARVEEHVF